MVDRWLTERARAAEAEVPGGFDLSECVREPIHLLGGVQSHGTLIAVEPASGVVVVAAANTGELLGAPPEELLGAHASRVLAGAELEEALSGTSGEDSAAVTFPAPVGGAGSRRQVDVSAHRRDGLLVLEFEPRQHEAPAFGTFYAGIRRALARLRSTSTVTEACAVAAREVRALTGYDRVMVYRFDGEAGPGEVVAEDLTPGWDPWLGLWFPATDVPPQARRLYRDNWIRVIGDVLDETVGLVPPVRPETGVPLDLSSAALRTVSGFHLEYLRNIGVRSSMSVSVLREGSLWGLIACHGARPLRPTPEVRSACEMFGAAFSLQLAAIEERERADAIAESGTRAARVARLLEDGLEESVADHGEAVTELLAADGVVLCRGGRVSGSGDAFPPGLVQALGGRAALLAPGTVWETDRLAEVDGEEAAFGAQPSVMGPAGVLLLPLSRSGDFLAWCRRERPVPRRWAADPAAPVRVGAGGERLTPRGSGAVFAAMMRGRSLEWTTTDRAAARELWRLLTGLVLRHADAVGALNDELRMTNLDLDGFAHAAAHDLKEPLRGISNAVTFTIEDAAARLDETTRRRLLTMQRLAGRMDELLNSLLHYARLGRAGLRVSAGGLRCALAGAAAGAGRRA
ncbi:GAF domain-containing protein, partial [Streptomyces bohaiensis]|uniref:GAF domain-containing protein n=1 Tax=Streptomyces bohaiensis TaxID=1431344 RepID=UPI003B7A1696